MRDQDIKVGFSYVNKTGRAERLILDRGPHLVGCGVWAGAEPDDFNHHGEDGVLYIETRLGMTRYGATSGRRPVARFVGAFAAWARKEVPAGQEASEYSDADIPVLCDMALSCVWEPKIPTLSVVWVSHHGRRVALVSHPSGFDATSETIELAAKRGRGSGKIPTQVFVVGSLGEKGEAKIREIIGDGAGGLCLSPMVRLIPSSLIDRRR